MRFALRKGTSRPICCHSVAAALAASFMLPAAPPALAQPLDERLDEDRLLQELTDLGLHEVLEHYIEMHPAAEPAQRILYEIAALRMRLIDPATSDSQRLRLLEEVFAARRALIEENPYDPRRPVWLADQAADYLFLLYPVDASGITAEFGLPSPDQRARAEQVAAETKRLASQAELEITETILNLESEPGYEDDIALQLRRRRLARDERDRRIPFLHGVGSYLNAEFNLDDSNDRRAAYELAADLLAPLERELEGALRTRARLYFALVTLRIGGFDEAEIIFNEIAADPESSALDRFAARIGAVNLQHERTGPAAALETLDEAESHYTGVDAPPNSVFFRMLIADRRFLLKREQALAMTAPELRSRGLIDAFAAYTDLLDEDLGVPRDTVRALVFVKLANAAEGEVPLAELPPIVTVARAENLSRDEATRAEAIELFRETLRREDDLDDATRAAAIFGLGRAHYDSRNWLEAARYFDTLAREHPGDAQAERAIEIAVALLADLFEKAPQSSEVETQLELTLTLLFERYPNLSSIDRWRYEAARLHFAQGEYAAARMVLEAIPPGAEVWPDSRFLLARNAMQEAQQRQDPAARREAFRDLAVLAAQFRESVQRAAAGRRDADRLAMLEYYDDSLRVIEAQARIEIGEADAALESLKELVEDPQTDAAVLGEALATRIRAFQRAGRAAEARSDVDAMFSRFPDRAPTLIPSVLRGAREEAEVLRDRGQQDEAQRKAQSDLLPLAQMFDRWISSSELLPEERTPLELAVADAYLLSGDHAAALPLYDRVLLKQPSALQAVLGKAEALFEAARFAEALPLYKRISDARRAEADAFFWQAEARMLQILDQAAPTEAHRRQILPRITRLRQIDEELGGPRFRGQFTQLELKYRGRS